MKKATTFAARARQKNTYKAGLQFLNNLQALRNVEVELVRLSDYSHEP